MNRPSPAPPSSVAVVVPTYLRPDALRRCLTGLLAQKDMPDEILVVRRAYDRAAAVVVAELAGRIGECVVTEPGVVHAMASGSRRAISDVVAFCDDDAVPRPDWVSRIRAAFADPVVGAVGGRDLLAPPHPVYPPTEDVGLLGSWGQLTGEHHRGAGAARDVDVLKAVNMAFRAVALFFPQGLRGCGAQVHFEVSMCLWAKERGWRLRYDPGLVVDHDPQQRFDADRRGRPRGSAVSDAAYNFTVSLMTCRPDLITRRLLYGLAVGDRGTPGIARAGAAALLRDFETVRRLGPSLAGQVAGFQAGRRGSGLVARPVRSDSAVASPALR